MREITPHGLVLLYVRPSEEEFLLGPLFERVCNLVREEGFHCLDFAPLLRLGTTYEQPYVSRFDLHPSPEIHGVMAERIEAELRELWPGLLGAAERPLPLSR